MSIVRFDENLGIPSEINTNINKIKWNDIAFPEYEGVRTFDGMKKLYENSNGVADNTQMYFTAGRISKKESLDNFKKNGVTYEYTVIPVKDVNGECNKTHGHIHGVNPNTGRRRLEAFEILHGVGCFELFKETKKNEFECLIILLEKGNRIIVPSDYFHLSINFSNDQPFIFSDLIKDDVDTVYSYVKDKNGAPYRVFHNDSGEIYYKLNTNWSDCQIKLRVVSCKELNWNDPFNKTLYESFIEDNQKIKMILEG